jgi:hypothetical protein
VNPQRPDHTRKEVKFFNNFLGTSKMKKILKLLLTLTNGHKSSTGQKIFWPKLQKKILLKNRLSIRVRNLAPLNEPLNIFIKKFYFNPQSRPHIETLWCKNQENPSDQNHKQTKPRLYVTFAVTVPRVSNSRQDATC